MANATEKTKQPKTSPFPRLSLFSLLALHEDDAVTAVKNASENEKRSLLNEFIEYHQLCLISSNDVTDISINRLVIFTKTCGLLLDGKLAVSKLIELSSYYENIGDIDLALDIAKDSLGQAEKISSESLQRKAHNRLGACYSRHFDFELSCLHYEKGLRLALSLAQPLYEFAILSNIVTLFDAMGLTREANYLAIKLSKLPDGPGELDLLHVQNAINGFRFSLALGNAPQMERFHRRASKKIQKMETMPEVWRAYYEANVILYLIHKGKLAEARSRALKWAKYGKQYSNVRASVTFLSASVECALATEDSDWLRQLTNSLVSALPPSKPYPPDYEVVLGLLVKVYTREDLLNGGQAANVYVRQLQEHVVNVRHRQFFKKMSREAPSEEHENAVLANPSYHLPLSIPQEDHPYDAFGNSPERAAAHADEFFINLEGHYVKPLAPDEERSLRSVNYCTAENWAVAAEFGSDGDGVHCFQVGALASKIAVALKFTADRCLLIELSCRLHDIGKVAVAEALRRETYVGKVDSFRYIREHTLAGERLLRSSQDPVLELAATVARSHHEWWNGLGYPDLLLGEAIPVEARICAVASEYAVLTNATPLRKPWSYGEAIRQLTTMAGVQFDPLIVNAFVGLKEADVGQAMEMVRQGRERLESNDLRIAKGRLEARVSLV